VEIESAFVDKGYKGYGVESDPLRSHTKIFISHLWTKEGTHKINQKAAQKKISNRANDWTDEARRKS
jgi:hypothetical protein